MTTEALRQDDVVVLDLANRDDQAAHIMDSKTSQRQVLKFGGTVCGRLPLEVVDICLAARAEGPIAVVCSARSGKTKAEGTTNLLLKAIRSASESGSVVYESIVADILKYHLEGTQLLTGDRAIAISTWIRDECNSLLLFLRRLALTGGHSSEAEDHVVSLGERLSTRFIATLLEEKGCPTDYVDLSVIVASDAPGPQREDFFSLLAERIGRRIEQCQDKVPVITGFFGMVPGGLLNICGRGYSDLLAALVAVGTDSKELQIWKEVSGVYTADPRKVPTATLLPTIHPSEANELTFYGSEVIHHFTIEQCIPTIPIRIKNVRDPEGSGTLISLDEERRNSAASQEVVLRRPTAVTVKDQITVVNVHSFRKVGSPEFLAKICGTLAKFSLAVDLFELNETHVSLAVHSKTPFIRMLGRKDSQEIKLEHMSLQLAIHELGTLGRVEVIEDMAILSLIGRGLKRSVGMAGKLFTALGNNNINIEMISQGASEINISCVITKRDSLRALNVVHTELFTFLD